jgi:hypothetical protein
VVGLSASLAAYAPQQARVSEWRLFPAQYLDRYRHVVELLDGGDDSTELLFLFQILITFQ